MASSIVLTGGPLDTTSGSWANAMLEIGQNAISTLLQPRMVRTGFLPHHSAPASSAHQPPTARDIPSVALTNIPHVDAADFEPYLNQFGALYEQLRRLKENEDEAADDLYTRSTKPDKSAAVNYDGYLRSGERPLTSRQDSVASVSSFSSVAAPSPIRRSSSGVVRSVTQGPPPLSTIPPVYFDEDFRLENPRIFDVVSERSNVVEIPPGSLGVNVSVHSDVATPRKTLATNAILQEKFSWYMDTIEMHLIASISTASATFGSALGSLRDLYLEAADSVEDIKGLRKELEALDKEIATSGSDIVRGRLRRNNLQQLHDTVQQLKHIVNHVAICESFVDDEEVEKALESIDHLENFIAGEVDHSMTPLKRDGQGMHLRALRGVTALQGVDVDLDTLRYRVGKVYETRFLRLLMGDLRRHTEAVSAEEILVRWAGTSLRSRGGLAPHPSVLPSYMSSTEVLRSELQETLTGLHRAKHLNNAITTYRDAMLKEIRDPVRRPLPTSEDDDSESVLSSSTTTGGKQFSQQHKSSILARNLRALQPEDAEELLVKIYINVTEMLRRFTTQAKLLLDLASSLGDDSAPTSRRSSSAALEAQEIHQATDLPTLLSQAVDVAQDKIVKLLRVRSEQSAHLSLMWFLRYVTLNRQFANECESISGRSGTSLQTVVNGHIEDFVQHYGDAETQKLAQGLESDHWEAKDFSKKDTAELNKILSCSTEDPNQWSDGLKLWIPYSSDEPEPGEVDVTQSSNGGNARTGTALIDEETFILPASAILCMNGLSHFLQLIVGIPSITSDISASLISYLELFNSGCTQLILRAGAKRSAGLRNITSKHLALASRGLAFIAKLISYVREFVRRHAGNRAAASCVAEFDRVKCLYQEHQNSIYEQIVKIMSRLAASHVKAMRDIDWDDGENSVHLYMATLAKDTTSLHRILTKTLPEGIVRMLMTSVFTDYKDQFGKAFQESNSKTKSGLNSMLHDVEFLESKLDKVDGYGDTGEYLTTIIKSKQVKSVASVVTD